MTDKMHQIEVKEGKPIKQVLTEAFELHGTQHAVASHLGVSQTTIWSWLVRLRLKQKTTLVEVEELNGEREAS